MNKTTIWYAAVLLVVYFTLVFCEESRENADTQLLPTDTELANMDTDSLLKAGRDLLEFEGRTRRHRHHFWLRHLWPLAIAYWIKVKVVIVSFFVGSAIYLGFRYIWPHARCHQEVILDHPPPSFSHDHTPYSLDHHEHEHYDSSSYDSSPSFEPYSGYSGYSGYSANSDIVSDYPSDPSVGATGPTGPTGPTSTRRRGKRSTGQYELVDTADEEVQQDEQVEIVDEEITESVARQQPAEEQIADFMFAFLGLDSTACRRRFVCEMEFRSKLNPLSSMAFRIVGRGFFEKYTNAHNPESRAANFQECAAVNPECVFVENSEPAEENTDTESTQKVEENTETESLEAQNEINLQAERRHAKLKMRRGDHKLSSIAEHILTQ